MDLVPHDTDNSAAGQDGQVLVVRATKKLLRLTGPPTAPDDERGTTLLASWHATVLFWRPRVVLLVNESTLLPVLLPLAPASTLTTRIGEHVAAVLVAHNAPAAIIRQERLHMQTCQLGATTNRSVVGVMTELGHLAKIHRDTDPTLDLVGLAVRLAATPCGPLYKTNLRPDRELAAVLQKIAT